MKKCLGSSCVTGEDANSANPFCGNALSAAAIMDNSVPIGECGPCQINPNGGGGFSKCSNTTNTQQNCPLNTSCPPDNVCCDSGVCAMKGEGMGVGKNCPDQLK